MKPAIAVITAAALTLGAPANAGPDETTRHLMNEYVTLLDWGVYRLTNRLDKMDLGSFWATASYDWDTNQIEIELIQSSKGKNLENHKAECRRAIGLVRNNAGYDPDGNLYQSMKHSIYAGLFSHTGFVNGGITEQHTRLADLDKKITIGTSTYFSGGVLHCSAKLAGTSVSFTE
ncbi:hypothetical protein BXY66_1194 [Shimia isoporae]|uniref:Uncharacterized protein n=1 Tax=Shimia isoporae TaxID=647720 RepID=A0A4R1NMY7_9RHOB|nr:hypothetical protein [Shimia isoporae]TCL09149.1 hypothetical protein BXY66_1194 [Shimia isoporae]